MKLKRAATPETVIDAEPIIEETVTRYVIHTAPTSDSVAVGAANTLGGAVHKALGRSGTHYIFKYITHVYIGGDEALLTPVFEQEVTRK